jgi:hypothetical protein
MESSCAPQSQLKRTGFFPEKAKKDSTWYFILPQSGQRRATAFVV